MTEPSKVVRLFCNNCARKTMHDLSASIREVDRQDVERGYGVEWICFYQTLKCRGCGSVTYRTTTWFSEDQIEDRPPIYKHTYYPPRLHHPKPEWLGNLSGELQQVLDEVYTALHYELNYLTAVGARTALDMMIVDKIGDIGTFQQKINTLEAV